MTKSERLLAIMETMRRQRGPITAAKLAAEQGVSERTIYRDVLALQTLEALIDGEAGIGYLLRPGFFLPPLSFTVEELEAIVLGARWVAAQPDAALADAANGALAKIAAAAPLGRTDALDDIGLWPVVVKPNWELVPILRVIRRAMREETAIDFAYTDEAGRSGRRAVWPVQLFFYEGKQILAAWCCVRITFRAFRIDRIAALTPTEVAFGIPRRELARSWSDEWSRLHPDWISPTG